MANPTVREKIVATPATGLSLTMTTRSSGDVAAIGDLLVCAHFYDYYTAASMTTPTGGGTWTLQATGDSGTNQMHVKVWTRPVTSSGQQTITVNDTNSDATHMPVVFLIDGDSTTLSVDGAAGSNGTNTTAHICPSVSPAGADNLLICGAGESPFGSGSYTWPGGMTEESDVSAAGASTASTATQLLTASGATGTRTATCTQTEDFCSFSITIRSEVSGIATENASGSGTANTITLSGPSVDEASGSGVAQDVGIGISVDVALGLGSIPEVGLVLYDDAPPSGTGFAYDVSVLTGIVVEAATASGLAYDISIATGGSVSVENASGSGTAYGVTISTGLAGLMGSISDKARQNMLAQLGISDPQPKSNTDLMREVMVFPGQTLVTVTNASVASHLVRYMMTLRG